MQKEHANSLQDCQIGVCDVSDHNAIYLKLKLNDTQKDTTWRLNVGIVGT